MQKITTTEQKLKVINQKIAIYIVLRRFEKCAELRDRINYKLTYLYDRKAELLNELC